MHKRQNNKMTGTNANDNGAPKVGTDTIKQGLAQMLKGGVIVSWFSLPVEARLVFGLEVEAREAPTKEEKIYKQGKILSTSSILFVSR